LTPHQVSNILALVDVVKMRGRTEPVAPSEATREIGKASALGMPVIVAVF
jgi:hypothetical protein